MSTNIDAVLASQQAFYLSGGTRSVSLRLLNLITLRETIQKYEPRILQALQEDLGKSASESYMCEIGMVLSEISYMLRHARRFASSRKVPTPLAQFAATSRQIPCPYGTVLIMSPWNYPFLLTLGPLVDAIAAGNTAVVKPSAYSPATASVLKDILSEAFPPELVTVITGGRQENAELLSKKFDMVFFTGSQTVGKEVLRRCAEHLTPAVLELGGKSPCIVDESAKIPLAAKRIVFGKYLNCGQTCVAPDYILCHRDIREELIGEIKKQIRIQFGEHPLDNPNYGKIISEKHFRRLLGLMDSEKTVAGGEYDETRLRIAPTVMDNVTWEDPVMQEEIFGPILPVLTFDRFEDIFPMLAHRPKPLALYIFSEDRDRVSAVTEGCAFGGGCVNDCIIHLATSHMSFGGVGESGMGSYHGEAGFRAFSHYKSIVDKKTWLDLPMRYQPYSKFRDMLIRMFLK